MLFFRNVVASYDLRIQPFVAAKHSSVIFLNPNGLIMNHCFDNDIFCHVYVLVLNNNK